MSEPLCWYGKLAMLGDFAQRRLPDAVVRPLDHWLASTMQALPQVLGERWPWAYLEAPLLRFAWAPGVLTADWWFGVLMPSCDNVGRYFPLWVGQPSALPPQDGAGLERLTHWYEAIARAALHTLEDGATVAAFEAELAAVPAWRMTDGAAVPVTLPAAVAAHAGAAWLAQLDGCTLWCPAMRQTGQPVALHCASGLPDASTVAVFLQAGPGRG